jgi:acyl-coenzyme A thioesterase PaaI-like protein
MRAEPGIRDRVLRGITLDRTPGYHFTGHFLSISHDHVAVEAARTSMRVGPHCAEADGGINYGALAVFADLSMAANVRAGHDLATRLAAVALHMNFSGAPIAGRIDAAISPQGYLVDAAGRLGATAFTMTAEGRQVCFGTGSFMVLDPPKGVTLHARQLRREGDAEAAPVPESDLTRDERAILRRTDAALAVQDGDAFIRRFWGFETRPLADGAAGTMKNGPHIANRVGHVQGGVTMGLGMATAEAAMPESWMISGVTAWFIGPGEGRQIRARSKIIHPGRRTAVVRTEITGKDRRRVMELITTHARRAE